jgi:tRNA U34 2-thiouridine synthase MnmA/TrmU
MFSRAAQYMKHIEADFVFTGEVLGQRPMSQMRASMKKIEKAAGLERRLMRPLCAQFLDPTIPEQEGLVDREKLLGFSGRSRKPQIELAESLNISQYNQPAGGCLLTDRKFANRMRDTLDHGYRNFRETIALKWGRHFRINNDFKVILGRNAEENESLIRYAHPDDHVMTFAQNQGPTLLLKGYDPSGDILAIAAGLIQQFSKYKSEPPQNVLYWTVADRNHTRMIKAKKLELAQVDQMYI